MDPHFVADLLALLGPKGLRQPADLAGQDAGVHPDNLAAGWAVLPETVKQVRDIVQLCGKRKVSIVPHGGRTGLSGAAISRPGQLIVMLDRFNAVEDLDPVAGVVTVGAGVTLQRLNEAAADHGLSAGIDLGARGTATIGGMISTNAGGNEAFRNGVMRQRVLGLEAVLPDGSIFEDLTRVSKVTDGYDVKQLLIGGEGTLGIVTRAALQLVPLVEPTCSALCACRDGAAALSLFNRLRKAADFHLLTAEVMFHTYATITAREIGLDSLVATPDATAYLLIEGQAAGGSGDHEAIFETHLMAAVEAEDVLDALIAKSEGERADFWRLREDWALERAYPNGLWYDVSIPHAQLDGYLTRLEKRIAKIDSALIVSYFGHLGDGNMHITVTNGQPLPEEKVQAVSLAVYDGLRAIGGALSAEHGIGLEKRSALARHLSPGKLAAMRAVKAALDPGNIMNPGKVL
ncbi:MAG: FAD-binding oxidoreductase [Pseudomonadota bacterium]